MMNLDIAVGENRLQEIWHNEKYTWERLVKRISATQRTHETYESYMASPKPRQAEIKDVGGFVGGYLQNGKRGKNTILFRQIVTLDIDFGYPELWEDFTMYYSCAALIYSTHAHSAFSPRLRIVLPLDRQVSPEEYEAIGRKISFAIGMKHFDATTFQAERLMYWPSTSKDGDYYFKSQAGPWLSADAVLAEYRDWTQISEWPLCPTEIELVRTGMREQADPAEKEGVIGAFCRAYPIDDVIPAFLSDQYTPAGEDRYTYLQGSTNGGAINYNNKFLYSHHNTDPAGGITCNSFDLVRLHKFGHLDKDPNASNDRKPSFAEMINFARKDTEVIRELGIFKLTASEPLPEGYDTDWLKKMNVNGKGAYTATINNFLLILKNDPKLKDKFAYNEFDHRDYATGDLPWSKGSRELMDRDEAGLRHYFESTYEIYHVNKCLDAFELASREHSFHPVRDYLNSLVWDGKSRLDTLFIDYLGAKDTPYTRAVTRKSLVAACARILVPGIKFDYMITLVGGQGLGKSSLLNDLGKDWFSDTLDSIAGKEAYMQIQGAWLIEMAELSNIRRADVEAVKHFISKKEDRFRVTFGKRNENFKRQCVFFGSTNEQAFLRDPTGNRRFWPIVVTKKCAPGTVTPIADQIWAEAMHYWGQNETLYLNEELEAQAMTEQLAHAEKDERVGLIELYLDMMLPANWEDMSWFERVSYTSSEVKPQEGITIRDKVCVAEIWCEVLGNKPQDMTPQNTKFLHNLLRNIAGWEPAPSSRSFKRYGNQRAYVRVPGSKETVVAAGMKFANEQHDWMN